MSTETRVGILVIAALATFAFFIIRIEEVAVFRPDGSYEIRIELDNIAGLTRDAPVLLAGVRVGRVESVGLTPDGKALVILTLVQDVKLYNDAIASVASMGVMGDKYLEVIPGTPGSGTVPEGGFIRGGEPISIDRMVAVVNDIAKDLERTTDSLSNVFGTEEGQASMKGILANVEGFSAELESFMISNRAGFEDGVGGFRRALQRIDRMSGDLEDSLPELVTDIRAVAKDLSGLIGDSQENLGDATDNLRRMSERLERSATEMEEVISKVNRGEGTVARLVNEPDTVEKLHEALESVDDTLAAADTFFQRVGQARFSFALRSEAHERSGATKNYFGVEIELGGQTSDRTFIFELVDDNIGDFTTTNTTIELFDDLGGLLDRTIERRVARQEGFSFSAQLAQRAGSWQFRGGLMESRAGGGVDYFVNEDRLRLSFEAWDFGRDPNPPHIKLRAQYRLFGRFFLAAGWDDIFSQNLQQLFLGGGYSFR